MRKFNYLYFHVIRYGLLYDHKLVVIDKLGSFKASSLETLEAWREEEESVDFLYMAQVNIDLGPILVHV